MIGKLIKNRRSIKSFTDKKPDWRKIIEAIDSARYAPMAGNIFNLKFILIDDKKKIENVASSCQQDFIKEAPYVLAVCSKPERLKSSFHEKSNQYTSQQTGAAIQNILLSLEEKGISTCWIGFYVDKILKKDLKIPDSSMVEALIAIGYKKGKLKELGKTDLDAALYFNKWGNKKMKPPK